MLMIKTRSSLLPELTDFVVTHHPYKVAEVIATDVRILITYVTTLTVKQIKSGASAYLDWVVVSTREPLTRS